MGLNNESNQAYMATIKDTPIVINFSDGTSTTTTLNAAGETAIKAGGG